MKDIWEKIMNAIKDTLYRTFGLDMDGSDERLAYLVYVMMMGDRTVRRLPKAWIKDAYALAPTDYWLDEKISFDGFQRSIYRSLKKAYIELGMHGAFEFYATMDAIIGAVKP